MSRVLLHGFLGDPSVWTGIVDGVALALPGHGGGAVQSTWDANLAAIAKEVRATVAIGYSLGARVALGLLAAGHVARAVVISGNPGLASAAPERAARRASDAAWARRFRDEPLALVLDAWEAQPLFATQARVDPARLAARRARRLRHDPQQLAASLVAMGLAEMPDYRATLAEAARAGTVTLVVGADDAKYRAFAAEAADTTGAAVHVIPGCGHDPLLEQPAALAEVLASVT